MGGFVYKKNYMNISKDAESVHLKFSAAQTVLLVNTFRASQRLSSFSLDLRIDIKNRLVNWASEITISRGLGFVWRLIRPEEERRIKKEAFLLLVRKILQTIFVVSIFTMVSQKL